MVKQLGSSLSRTASVSFGPTDPGPQPVPRIRACLVVLSRSWQWTKLLHRVACDKERSVALNTTPSMQDFLPCAKSADQMKRCALVDA